MTLFEILAGISGLAIGYWLISAFLGRDTLPDEPLTREAPAASGDDAEQPWWDVLQTTWDASDDEIRAAYRRQISQYHPDKVATLAPDIRALAEQRSAQINAAYAAALRR